MLGSKDLPIISVKVEVGVAQINEKFQLHQIVTEFGVAGVLMNAIKSCKVQLDRDAALAVHGMSTNPIVAYISSSDFHSKNDFFQKILIISLLIEILR
jgi:hypothetical protein